MDGMKLAGGEQLPQCIGEFFGDDDEQRRVDRIDAFAKDRELATTLPDVLQWVFSVARLWQAMLPHQERPGVLKIVARHHAAERLARRQRLAVAGIDIANSALRHRDQRASMHAVLPPPIAKVDAATQEVRLKTSLAIERENPALGDRSLERPQFFHNRDAVVRNEPQRQPDQDDELDRDDSESNEKNGSRSKHRLPPN